jgi:hypothetical protein
MNKQTSLFSLPRVVLPKKHNHAWFEAEEHTNLLFHPDCDPRILQDTCPACKEFMQNWHNFNQRLMREGV